MVTENNMDNVISMTKHQIPGPEKAGAPQPAKAVQQTLPAKSEALPAKKEETEVEAEKLNEIVRDLNEHVQSVQRELEFSVDKESGNFVIKVFDSQSEALIRQIPNEEAMKFERMLNEGADLELFNTYT